MAKVTNRPQLIDHAMRALGAPVIEINVDEDQVEDRIDDALQYYQEYHTDAVIRVYYKHQLTATDITNSYITIPDGITSITRILDFGSGLAEKFFDVEYNMRLQDMYMFNVGSRGLQLYEQRVQNLALLDYTFGSTELLRFNRHMNRLHIDEGFGDLFPSSCSDVTYTDKTTCEAASETWTEGQYIVIEGYEIVDPTTYGDVYNDMFLKRYVTALIKRQWGANMIKFEGMQLPGGVTMNGRQIYDDAVEEVTKLEDEMQLAWMEPDNFLMG